MGYFYFDESIHTRGHFSLGGFVYSEESLHEAVLTSLKQSGLRPGIDEFKSGYRMDLHPEQAQLRSLLRTIICDRCRIGLIVAPDTPRDALGEAALRGLRKILMTNGLEGSSHDVFFDEGIFASNRMAEAASNLTCDGLNCKFHFEQDSVSLPGLQVADLIAHTCSTMLLAELGLVKKTVKMGGYAGYPEENIGIEFDLWAGLRWNFFAAGPPPIETWKSQRDFQVDVQSNGLYIAETCEERVKEAALNRFGKMCLGCIH